MSYYAPRAAAVNSPKASMPAAAPSPLAHQVHEPVGTARGKGEGGGGAAGGAGAGLKERVVVDHEPAAGALAPALCLPNKQAKSRHKNGTPLGGLQGLCVRREREKEEVCVCVCEPLAGRALP